jgi:hypothetical protein
MDMKAESGRAVEARKPALARFTFAMNHFQIVSSLAPNVVKAPFAASHDIPAKLHGLYFRVYLFGPFDCSLDGLF